MRRILFFVLTAVFAASLNSFAFAADKAKSSKMASTTVKCKTGQTLVKGYTKKDGTKVAPYCRSASTSMAKTKKK